MNYTKPDMTPIKPSDISLGTDWSGIIKSVAGLGTVVAGALAAVKGSKSGDSTDTTTPTTTKPDSTNNNNDNDNDSGGNKSKIMIYAAGGIGVLAVLFLLLGKKR